MAKDDQEEAYERLLAAALTRTIDLLKFAEAKNAALLTFCSAWAFGSINILTSDKSLPDHIPAALKTAFPLFVLAGLICIASFLPKLNPKGFYRRRQPRGLNLLFFGDVATIGPSNAAAVLKKYYPVPGRTASDAYLEDLVAQYAINSQIAATKYRMFNIAALLTLAALAILACPEVSWIWHRLTTWLLH